MVSFIASKNTGAARTGTVTIGRQTFFLQQESAIAGGLFLSGSFPHLVSGDGWDTRMTIVNVGAQSSEALLTSSRNMAVHWTCRSPSHSSQATS